MWDKLRETSGGPYPPAAYVFVQEGLRRTADRLYRIDDDGPDADGSRHVTGQELCIGLRDFAVQQYGSLARFVLEQWGIRRTADFGRIVFAMVEVGLLRKTDDDSIADFEGVFDFAEAFADEPAAMS
jgi:uncharacterized repeat protein (TIGR04138 family)